MIPIRSLFLSLLLVLLAPPAAVAADQTLSLALWPAKVPADLGLPNNPDEKFIELKMNGKAYQVAGRPTKWLTNVTKPTITLYPAPRDSNTRVAMIICPGGGYHNLGWDIEGEEVAA